VRRSAAALRATISRARNIIRCCRSRGARRRVIHPSAVDAGACERFKGNGWLANTIGNPLDTTIALQHLIFEGRSTSFPGSRSSRRTGGGYLPSYAMRGDHACFVSPHNCDPGIQLKKKGRRNISISCITTRWCFPAKGCAISWRRSARAS
jgi:hypothetical protein